MILLNNVPRVFFKLGRLKINPRDGSFIYQSPKKLCVLGGLARDGFARDDLWQDL